MRWKPFLLGVILGLGILGAPCLLYLSCHFGGRGGWLGRGGVALVEVNGGIYVADDTVKQLEEARKADRIRAVVLRINSPGGAVGASQEIYQALLKLSETKPIVASMGEVAASGGYYIACPARRIFAMPGTITGSIGVRMSHVDAGELFRWAKIAPETLKSGAFKDAGSIYRPLSAEERALFDGILTDMHDQFKEAVAAGRGLTREAVDAFADGRILTGRQALDLKLIDAIGGLPEAIAEAGKLAGITGEPRVVKFERSRPWWWSVVWEGEGRAGAWARAALGDWLHSLRLGYWAY